MRDSAVAPCQQQHHTDTILQTWRQSYKIDILQETWGKITYILNRTVIWKVCLLSYIKNATRDKQIMLKDLVKCNIIYIKLRCLSEGQKCIPIHSMIDIHRTGALVYSDHKQCLAWITFWYLKCSFSQVRISM
jgi:hypothetical protein